MQSLENIAPRWWFGAAGLALVLAFVGVGAGWAVGAPMAFLAFILLTIFGAIFWTTPPSALRQAEIDFAAARAAAENDAEIDQADTDASVVEHIEASAEPLSHVPQPDQEYESSSEHTPIDAEGEQEAEERTSSDRPDTDTSPSETRP